MFLKIGDMLASMSCWGGGRPPSCGIGGGGGGGGGAPTWTIDVGGPSCDSSVLRSDGGCVSAAVANAGSLITDLILSEIWREIICGDSYDMGNQHRWRDTCTTGTIVPVNYDGERQTS